MLTKLAVFVDFGSFFYGLEHGGAGVILTKLAFFVNFGSFLRLNSTG
jgi:hypothetical protein